jgi:transposase InsO family protein
MLRWTLLFLAFLFSCFRSRSALARENLVLRQQLSVALHRGICPRLSVFDRLFWAALSRCWSDWADALAIVKPATVIRWHRLLFKSYWRRKSRPGRKPISRETIALIGRLHDSNPTWGAPRIHGELLLLGIDVSEATISRYLKPRRRTPRRPSQTWRTFLANHAPDIAAIDFFTVPTATFRVLFGFLVLSHDRRRILHVNVTDSPCAPWTAQQIVEAFPDNTAPRFLLRDRDGIYGTKFRDRVQHMGIEEILTAPRSPWQNGICERVIGSIRRDCLDHVIILDERHLLRILRQYVAYYNESRTHLALGKDCPIHRAIEPPESGPIREIAVLGGLHHRYTRRAA